MRVLLLLAGTSVLLAGIQAPTPAEKFRPYRTWVSVTPSPVDMSPSVAYLCDVPRKWMSPNPHMPKVFRVFVNPAGEKGFRSDRPKFPIGTMILKEKFDRRQTDGKRRIRDGELPELFTAMVKRKPGFDPKNGDWEYLILDRAMNRIEMKDATTCQSCHRQVKDRDFVFADYINGFLSRWKPAPAQTGSRR